MRSIRFGDFLSGQSTDAPEEVLYVLRSHVCLYVGISRISIWDRWFDSFRGHIRNGLRYGASEVGAYVLEHLPDSLDWTIEFWTSEDCRKIVLPDKRRYRNTELKTLEVLMIKQLKPALNVIHNREGQVLMQKLEDDSANITKFYKTLGDE